MGINTTAFFVKIYEGGDPAELSKWVMHMGEQAENEHSR